MWYDQLLAASYSSGALRTLPISDMAAMLRALGVLGVQPSALWLQRLWRAAAEKLPSSTAAEVAALLGAAAKLLPAVVGGPQAAALHQQQWHRQGQQQQPQQQWQAWGPEQQEMKERTQQQGAWPSDDWVDTMLAATQQQLQQLTAAQVRGAGLRGCTACVAMRLWGWG